MATPKFGPASDPSIFQTHRTDRETVVIVPELLAQITGLFGTEPNIVQGQDFYTATKDDADKYNSEREQAHGQRVAAGTAKPEDGPAPASLVDMAIRAARKDASALTPYLAKIVDTNPDFAKYTYSLRFVNKGTEDHPKVLFAFVRVNKRPAKAK